MRSQGGVKKNPHMAYWYDYHKHWDNHALRNCYNFVHQAKEQAMGNTIKGPTEGAKVVLMLDRQPPLPRLDQ